MAEDRSYIDVNDRERERLRTFIASVDDDALSAPANEYWTVAGVLGHLAYWDSRVLVFADKIDRGEPWVPSDAEPIKLRPREAELTEWPSKAESELHGSWIAGKG